MRLNTILKMADFLTALPSFTYSIFPLVNMNGTESMIMSVHEEKGNKQKAIIQRNPNSINKLSKNGIIVETNKGLVCLPLKDTLNKRMTEPSFESEEFQTGAVEMLLHGETEPIILPDSFWTDSTDPSKNLSKHLKEINNKTKDTWCKSLTVSDSFNTSQVDLEEFKNFQDSLLDFSTLEYSFLDKITVDSEDINKKLSDSVVNTLVVGNKKCFGSKKSLILKNTIKPVISVKKIVKSLSNKNNLGSVLINSNSATQSLYESYVSNEETSDNSEVTSVVADEPEIKPTKKRGGWPKGRKRKPEVKYEVHPPKAPATGYVIFLNEKRKEYRDMPFTEVTKLLGNEWSKLSLQEKKIYLDQAEIEKKRYREELKLYRLSDAYKSYLNKKKLKRLQENGTEESDMDATDEIDEEDNEELYCRSCDQWFHSLHNKREHLYGRQHLQSIASRCSKVSDPDWCNPNMSSTSLDESSLDGSSYLKGNKEHCCTKSRECLNMDDAMVRFMVANKEREEERKILKRKLEEIKDRNQCLSQELQQLNETVDSLTCMMESERTAQILLEQRLFNLLNVPTLFYLPEPLNEDNS